MPRHSLRNSTRRPRAGAVVILVAVILVVLLGLIALAVDVGYVMLTRGQMQRSADAAALAGAWELASGNSPLANQREARKLAVEFAKLNPVCGEPTFLDPNVENVPDGDVVCGRVDFSNPAAPMKTDQPASYNAVKVRIRRTDEANGVIPLFFARVFGMEGLSAESEATAGLINRVRGFKVPSDRSNVPILPIAMRSNTWDELTSGTPHDEYRFDEKSREVKEGSDGVSETLLYPEKTGAPGNFGTVNIGRDSNSTKVLSRQIRDGIREADLDAYSGRLQLDANGQLLLSGDPGVSFGIKDALKDIRGEPRVIPIYEEVTGSGSNAVFRIVRFAGVRIMAVDTDDGSKHIIVQPADVVLRGAIPTDQFGTSARVYSPAVLVD